MRVGLTMAAYNEIYDAWEEMWQPGGLAYLTAYIAVACPDVEIVVERDISTLIAHKPDLIGLSSTTHCYGFARSVARQIKDALGIPVIVGGPHITLAPEHLDPVFDVGVVSEGEQTFADLLKLYGSARRFECHDLRRVPGIVYFEDGHLTRTSRRPPIDPLDGLPHRARDQFWQWGNLAAQATLFTSRGCPYQCKFCSTVEVWGRKMRRHGPRYIADEVESLRERFDTKMFWLTDDLFAVNAPYVESVAAELRARRLHEGVKFRCTGHVQTVSPRMADALASFNVRVVEMGLESGSSTTLRTLGKAATREANERALEVLRAHGLLCESVFILGTPGETRDDIRATFDFVFKNLDAFEDLSFCPLIPLPGTPIFRLAQAQLGIALDDVLLEPEDLADWDKWVFNKYPYLNGENVPLQEMVNYIKIGRTLSETMPGHIAAAVLDPKIGEYKTPPSRPIKRSRSGSKLLPVVQASSFYGEVGVTTRSDDP